MRIIAVTLAIALVSGGGWTCPYVEWPITQFTGLSAYIAQVRVTAVHEVAGVEVAEVEVLADMKGAPTGPKIYLPLDQVQTKNGEAPAVGDRAIAVVLKGSGYRQTRAFWTDVDALRSDAPLIESGLVYWLSLEGQQVAIPTEIALPPGTDELPLEIDGASTGWRLTPADGFIAALEDAIARELVVDRQRRVDE